jgi:large subunit ribosomal protein L22
VRVAPQKARRLIDAVRGKDAQEAVALMRFTPGRAAVAVRKLLESAVANAENNHNLDRDALWVSKVYVDHGPSLRRMRPGSIGRASVIRRRTSHITVVLAERERAAPAGGRARRGRRT